MRFARGMHGRISDELSAHVGLQWKQLICLDCAWAWLYGQPEQCYDFKVKPLSLILVFTTQVISQNVITDLQNSVHFNGSSLKFGRVRKKTHQFTCLTGLCTDASPYFPPCSDYWKWHWQVMKLDRSLLNNWAAACCNGWIMTGC